MTSQEVEPVARAGALPRDVVAFCVDGIAYRWEDVFAFARRSGDWPIFETGVRQALACLRLAADEGPALARDAQRSAEAAFRRARRLLAGEDLEAWLSERDVTVTQWRRYIRGEALRRRHAAELDTVTARHPPGDEEVDAALSVWGTCSETFSRWAGELATRAAAAHATCSGDDATPPPSPDDLEAHEALFDRFAGEVATPERLEALVASRYLDWLRVDCDVAVFGDPDTAAEGRLCVRDDGWSLDEAARAGGAALRRHSLLVEEVDVDVRHHFVRARDGDLLGPLELADGPSLVQVWRKSAPSLDDEEVRVMATHELVDRAAYREVTDRVEWRHPR